MENIELAKRILKAIDTNTKVPVSYHELGRGKLIAIITAELNNADRKKDLMSGNSERSSNY